MSRALSPSFCSLLMPGARRTRVEDLARAKVSIALAKRRRRTRSPVALVRSAHVRTRNWQIISAGKYNDSRLHGGGVPRGAAAWMTLWPAFGAQPLAVCDG